MNDPRCPYCDTVSFDIDVSNAELSHSYNLTGAPVDEDLFEEWGREIAEADRSLKALPE